MRCVIQQLYIYTRGKEYVGTIYGKRNVFLNVLRDIMYVSLMQSGAILHGNNTREDKAHVPYWHATDIISFNANGKVTHSFSNATFSL